VDPRSGPGMTGLRVVGFWVDVDQNNDIHREDAKGTKVYLNGF